MIVIKEYIKEDEYDFEECISCGTREDLYIIKLGISEEPIVFAFTICGKCSDALRLLLECRGSTMIYTEKSVVKEVIMV